MRGILLLSLIVAGGCSTPPPRSVVSEVVTSPKAPRKAAKVRPVTILPADFSGALGEAREPLVIVPPGMLNVAKVVRPRAEVRSGPGAQFELGDKVLAEGAEVLVFNRVGVWRKIVVMATSQSGWVHAQALSEPRLSEIALRVDVRRLPTVLAVRDVGQVRGYPTSDVLNASVPRGAMFRSLRHAENNTLVWLPETGSVMWMSRKDVQ